MTPAQIQALTPQQIAQFNQLQMQALTTEQLTAFTAIQIQALTNEQISWFNEPQMQALITNFKKNKLYYLIKNTKEVLILMSQQ